MSSAAFELSIIIPSYNEERRLPETLERIAAYLRASGREAEILVVDDGSTDRTAAIAETDDLAGLLMQIDARIVGAAIAIDIGSREAARDALVPIADVLAQLSARSAPLSR